MIAQHPAEMPMHDQLTVEMTLDYETFLVVPVKETVREKPTDRTET